METENVIPETAKSNSRSKFSEEQKRKIVDEHNEGATVPELQSKYGINSNSTIYMWKKSMEKKKSVVRKKKIKRTIKAVNTNPPQSMNGDLGAENQILRNLIIDIILGKGIK